MIETEKFAFIHQPKTGGSFVTEVLFHLHLLDVRFLKLKRLLNYPKENQVYDGRYGRVAFSKRKHGTCSRLLGPGSTKRVLASVRNPFDRYVSHYEFGWWKRPPFHRFYRAVPGFEERWPEFPDLDFEAWMRLMSATHARDGHTRPFEETIGLETQSFARYFFRDPEAVIDVIDAAWVGTGACREAMFDVAFIFTHRLNEGLHDFLLEKGYAEEDVAFVLGKKRVLPYGRGRTEKQAWPTYYTPELFEIVRRKEAPLLAMFPEFAAAADEAFAR